MKGVYVSRPLAALAVGLAGGLAGCGGDSNSSPPETVTPEPPSSEPTATSQILRNDVLVQAEIWEVEPKIYTANLAVVGSVGIPGMSLDDLARTEQLVRMAGGNWSHATGANPTLGSYTSSPGPDDVAGAFGYPAEYTDGLPIVFSWPVLPSSINPEDFLFTLSNGTQVTPQLASFGPNVDYNERSTVVVFGSFGNRLSPGTPGAIYPVKVEVVDDGTPLQLVGPGPRFVNAVGMSAQAGTSYGHPLDAPQDRAGPRLVAAKLTRMSNLGDIAPPFFLGGASPNDGLTLYGDEAAMRHITAVEVPSQPPYSAVYNPGGPGSDSTPGVRYSAASPAHVQPVWIALDEVTQVTYIAPGLELPDALLEQLEQLEKKGSAP